MNNTMSTAEMVEATNIDMRLRYEQESTGFKYRSFEHRSVSIPKNESPLLRKLFSDLTIQILSASRWIRKGLLNIEHVVSQRISLQQHEPTKNNYRDFHVIVQEDKTLRCKENGQKIPSTHQGEIDKKKLEQEIAHGKWIPLPK